MQEPLHLPFYDKVIEVMTNKQPIPFAVYHSTFPVYFFGRKKGMLQEAIAFSFLEPPLKPSKKGLQLERTHINNRVYLIQQSLKEHLGKDFSFSMRHVNRYNDTFHSPVIAVDFQIGRVIASRTFPGKFNRAILPLKTINKDLLIALIKSEFRIKNNKAFYGSEHEPVVLTNIPELPLGDCYGTFYLHFPVHIVDFEKFVAYENNDPDRKLRKFWMLYRDKSSNADPQVHFNSDNRAYWQH